MRLLTYINRPETEGDGVPAPAVHVAPAANRPAHAPDPYAPVEKRRLMTGDAMLSRGFTVRRADPTAPTGWAECGVVSEDYALVENAALRDLTHEVAARSGLDWTEEKVFFDGRRYRLVLVAPDAHAVEVAVGDTVGLGLVASNAYDGTLKLSLSLVAFRLACRNGLCVPSLFKRVAIRHDGSARGWEAEVRAALAMVAGAGAGMARFGHAARVLASQRLPASTLRTLRTTVVPKLPVSLWGRSVDRLLRHEELSPWGLLQAVTHECWHAERPTAADYAWNEYASTALVGYALGAKP